MIKVHYPDRIYGFDEYETVTRRRKAKKRSRKEKNDKNRQK